MGDVKNLQRCIHGDAQRLPSVTCLAHIESGRPARDNRLMMSCLTVVWFQDVFAFPIDPDVRKEIIGIDWNKLAKDSDY